MKVKKGIVIVSFTLTFTLFLPIIFSHFTENYHKDPIIQLPVSSSSFSPIKLNGNNDLVNFPNKTGSGSLMDPYVIENIEIFNPQYSSGIEIRDINIHLVIINCRLYNSKDSRLSTRENANAGIKLVNSSNINIERCIFDGNFNSIILLSSVSISIIENNISNSDGYGLKIIESQNINIINNFILENRIGIKLERCDANNIVENTVSDNWNNNIVISYSKFNLIESNSITDSQYHGIVLDGSTSNTIIENTVKNSDLDGIFLYKSEYNNISKNEVSNNTKFGIELQDSHYNTLEYNNIWGNGESNFTLDASSLENELINNSVDNPVLEPIKNSLILLIIIIVVLIGIFTPIIVIYFRRRKKRENREYLANTLSKLSKLFKQNIEKIEIDIIAEKLEMKRTDLLTFMIQNYNKLKGIKIQGDFIIVSSQEDINQFIKLLDEQFMDWKKGEKDKSNKK